MADRKDKELAWAGTSKEDMSAFPKDAKSIAGYQLRRIQQGFGPDRWRPMPDVGAGVEEIIIQTDDAYRVFYVAKFEDRVHVLHAFQKKTRKTNKNDLELGRQRYREVVREVGAHRAKTRKGSATK